MKFKYIDMEDIQATEKLHNSVNEFKKSVNYLFQSMTNRDTIESYLNKLGEYSDSIILKASTEGYFFDNGECSIHIDGQKIDVVLEYYFTGENGLIEKRTYKRQENKEAFTDTAYEELMLKKKMVYRIER